MIIDEWRGQGVYRSDDLEQWERSGLILDQPGSREDDGTIGLHADVVVQGDEAYIFYFTHPERTNDKAADNSYAMRRSSIQAARLDVVGGVLVCDLDGRTYLMLSAQNPGYVGYVAGLPVLENGKGGSGK
jgi:hypothetical protein